MRRRSWEQSVMSPRQYVPPVRARLCTNNWAHCDLRPRDLKTVYPFPNRKKSSSSATKKGSPMCGAGKRWKRVKQVISAQCSVISRELPKLATPSDKQKLSTETDNYSLSA